MCTFSRDWSAFRGLVCISFKSNSEIFIEGLKFTLIVGTFIGIIIILH